MSSKKEFILNGKHISSLDEFYEVQSVLCPNFNHFRRNMHAFNDILSGGFGDFELEEEVSLRITNIGNIKKKTWRWSSKPNSQNH